MQRGQTKAHGHGPRPVVHDSMGYRPFSDYTCTNLLVYIPSANPTYAIPLCLMLPNLVLTNIVRGENRSDNKDLSEGH